MTMIFLSVQSREFLRERRITWI